jgi:hypothetical protein
MGGPVNPAGRCYRVATLAAAPVATIFLGSITAASLVEAPSWITEIGGAIAIAPGSYISLQTTTAAAVFVSYLWEEVPQ